MSEEERHTSLILPKPVWKDLKVKAVREERALGDLLREAVYSYYGYEERGEDQGDIKKDLDTGIVDLSKKVEGRDLGSDQRIREITLSCLRYLKNQEGPVTHKDFKKDVYPDFEDQVKEDSFWKIARSGMEQIEDLGGPVEVPKGRGHTTYTWKGD